MGTGTCEVPDLEGQSLGGGGRSVLRQSDLTYRNPFPEPLTRPWWSSDLRQEPFLHWAFFIRKCRKFVGTVTANEQWFPSWL